MNEKMQPTAPQTAFNDPQCTVTNTPTGDFPYAATPSQSNISDAEHVIGQLTYPDIWQIPTFEIPYNTVKCWVTVTAGGGREWRVRTGDFGNDVIADIEIQENLATASTRERQAYVLQMVQAALRESL